MLADRIEGKWIDAFCEIFTRCGVKRGDAAAILSETQSRPLNVQLAELALLRLAARPFHIVVPTPPNRHPVPVRSTGASEAIGRLAPVVSALGGLRLRRRLHARRLDACAGNPRHPARRRAHPGHLERASGSAGAHAARSGARDAAYARRRKCCAAPNVWRLPRRRARGSTSTWRVPRRSASGAGPTGPERSRIGRAGIVVSFPKSGTVNGTLVLDRGDVNLTFKRYLEARSSSPWRTTTSAASRAREPMPR